MLLKQVSTMDDDAAVTKETVRLANCCRVLTQSILVFSAFSFNVGLFCPLQRSRSSTHSVKRAAAFCVSPLKH